MLRTIVTEDNHTYLLLLKLPTFGIIQSLGEGLDKLLLLKAMHCKCFIRGASKSIYTMVLDCSLRRKQTIDMRRSL